MSEERAIPVMCSFTPEMLATISKYQTARGFPSRSAFLRHLVLTHGAPTIEVPPVEQLAADLDELRRGLAQVAEGIATLADLEARIAANKATYNPFFRRPVAPRTQPR